MKKKSLTAVLAGSMLLPCSGKTGEESSDAARPNLLVIQTDEHNFRTLGCYRKYLSPELGFVWGAGNNVETPNIDFLADNGVLFTKFYAATPVSSPSRASLISGKYPQNTGVPNNDKQLNDDIITYSEVLKNSGYSTAYFGKWHLDGDGKPQWEPKRKFGFENNHYMFNRGHWKKLTETADGPQVGAVDANGVPNYQLNGADEKTFTTDFLTDRVIDFIKSTKKEPFSVFLSIPDPHGPDVVRAPYDTMYSSMNFKAPATFYKTEEQTPGWGKKEKDTGIDQSQYFGMVKCIDDNVGKLFEYLRCNGLMHNTIIVFTSDHGDLRAEHHRQNKGVPYESSAKVPFIVYYPPMVPKGKVVHNALNTTDFAPTILTLMGYDNPDQMEGRDLSALITNPELQDNFEDITFVRSTTGAWTSAVTSRYKLVISETDDPWLLDLEADPDELINFINESSKKEVINNLANELTNYAKKYHDEFLSVDRKMGKDLIRLLEY